MFWQGLCVRHMNSQAVSIAPQLWFYVRTSPIKLPPLLHSTIRRRNAIGHTLILKKGLRGCSHALFHPTFFLLLYAIPLAINGKFGLIGNGLVGLNERACTKERNGMDDARMRCQVQGRRVEATVSPSLN